MRLQNLDNTSIKYYLTEDLKKDSALNEHWDRIDNGFFKPWQQHLKLVEAQITADQVQQIFAAAEKEQSATGGNSTMLGKIVEKLIPDSMVKKLSDSLPEPDPNAVNDPKFQQKATQAVTALPVDDQTKGGLMQIVKNAASNPTVQPIILSLVGGVLGGLVQKVGPSLSAFGLPGTVIAGVSGAVVAGGVAVALAKIQGKSWKDAFKGAIKPALAGAAGAVLGKMAADFVGGIGSGGGKAAAGGLGGDAEAGMAADQSTQDRLLNKFPPDQGYTFDANGKSVEVFDANGNKVFTGDIPLKTMDAQTFADLANQGKMATPGISSGAAASDPLAGTGISDKPTATSGITVANEPVIPGQPLSQTQMAVVDMSRSMGNTPSPAVQAAYDLAKQSASNQQTQSREYVGPRLSEGQVYMVFNRVVARNDRLLTEGWLVEGPLDFIKNAAKNLTTKVTADKLNKAWKAAGSPLDSEALSKILGDAGVNADVTKKVYADLKIDAGAAPAAVVDIETVKQMLTKLPIDSKVKLLKYLTKQPATAAV